MLRIGICDDSKEARFTLRFTLERILEQRGMDAALLEFSSGDGLLTWFSNHTGELDLVFLDIEMDGSNGMQTAKSLRARSQSIQIVFVTGYPDFVFDGYAVGALGYLMKPPASEKLDEVLSRALDAMQVAADDVYLCRNAEGTYRIEKSDILYFSSEKRVVTCVTKNRTIPFYARLDDVAQEVGQGFVRIHQRYLVSVAHVERVQSDCVRIQEQAFPISRAYQKAAVVSLTRALLR